MSLKSHSTRVRGLKFRSRLMLFSESTVALYTSAWIEMCGLMLDTHILESHSTRVRGLK